MTTPRDTSQDQAAHIGVRTAADVEAARRDDAAERRSPQFRAGASAAYEWATGHAERAPVTAAGAAGVPGLPLLTAEVDAVVVQLEDRTVSPGTRDYLSGVHDALAWICGYSDQPA
ncbi:hypothetical protein ACLGI4_27580 [Streptomyces sp. HMX112]|uniref:hypothetical protein n=1 Tax=Streptomyces sp. HMX112 TaxID=3390850 RepID=UPI003A8074D9